LEKKTLALLARAQYGHISTIGENGFPYTVGINLIYLDGSFYFHCSTKGEKLDNIIRDPRVCVNIDEMFEVKTRGVEEPCKVGVRYESVVARGQAFVVTDEDKRIKILSEIVSKYAPSLAHRSMPAEALKRTCVIEIAVDSLTYKERG